MKMPNYCKQILAFMSEDKDLLQEIKEKLFVSEERPLSLDRMIPMPATIKAVNFGVPDSRTILRQMLWYLSERSTRKIPKKDKAVLERKYGEMILKEEWSSLKNRSPYDPEEAYSHGKLFFEALKDTGYTDWYSWSVDTWGTKWDAWDIDLEEEDGRLEYTFYTAWSPAVPPIMEFAKEHPKVGVSCLFADEDVYGTKGEIGFDSVYGPWEDIRPDEDIRFWCSVWEEDEEETEKLLGLV